MRAILLVDDEPNVIKGMMRMLNSAPGNYQYLFAQSGSEALDILNSREVHMIVSDIRMPEMDGAQLLEQVMKVHPNIIRIILSGHSEKAMNLKAAGVAHQFLIKPCSPELLLNTIEKAFRVREHVHNEEVAGFVTGLNRLPATSTSFNRLLKELNSTDPSLKRVGEIIAEDLTMTAKVLQLVNSAFFGIPRKVSSAQQAVTLLGINTIKALALQVELFSAHQNRDDAVMKDLLNHSLKVGNLAKAISLSEKREARQADAALVGGILHDIGKVLLYMLPEYRNQLAVAPVHDHSGWLDMEYRLWGTSHAEIGAYLLGLWGFADDVVETVAFHHRPGISMDRDFSALTAVHIANALVRGPEAGDEYIAWLDIEYLESLNVLGHLNDWADICSRFEQAENPKE